MDRCVTCQFYDRNTRNGEGKAPNAGQCRRTAPALSPINQKTYMIEGVWPTVRDDDWCGEWKALTRRADAPRLGETLSSPLAASFPAPSTPAPKVSVQSARAALAAFGTEVRAAPVSSISPLASLAGGSRGDD